IRFVLMIGTDHLDRLTLDYAVEIRSRHLGGNERAWTCGIGVEAAHIGEHPDLDNIIGNLGACRGWTNYCRSEAKHDQWLCHPHSKWPTLNPACGGCDRWIMLFHPPQAAVKKHYDNYAMGASVK